MKMSADTRAGGERLAAFACGHQSLANGHPPAQPGPGSPEPAVPPPDPARVPRFLWLPARLQDAHGGVRANSGALQRGQRFGRFTRLASRRGTG